MCGVTTFETHKNENNSQISETLSTKEVVQSFS